ncbi:hypothetical protein HaLaN_26055 [Haematococcus lacustris]|uniref:Uncharacterized protein n=1 Tax=Haematococcus lacustris TaxID=44745 RepID=A0A6A0A5B4_HAELA|nr:hypothetical protein HaLaN_26055 [Haematococcus lacustris]
MVSFAIVCVGRTKLRSIADKAAGLAQTSVASGAAPYHQLDAALLQSHALRLGQPFPVPGTGPSYSSSNLRHNGSKRPAATSCQSAVEDIAEELLLTNSQFANMSHEKRMKITSQLADRSLMLDNPLRGRSRGASVRVSSLRSAVTWVSSTSLIGPAGNKHHAKALFGALTGGELAGPATSTAQRVPPALLSALHVQRFIAVPVYPHARLVWLLQPCPYLCLCPWRAGWTCMAHEDERMRGRGWTARARGSS